MGNPGSSLRLHSQHTNSLTVHQLNFALSGMIFSAASCFDSGPNSKKDRALKELSNDNKHKVFSCCQSRDKSIWSPCKEKSKIVRDFTFWDREGINNNFSFRRMPIKKVTLMKDECVIDYNSQTQKYETRNIMFRECGTQVSEEKHHIVFSNIARVYYTNETSSNSLISRTKSMNIK